ncbi:allantoate permease [Annulohypoxylon maeteangense]|uniref:allantoate permease n=1 Tax=Annulohypoxylon maeteangense TaxID=1927788 RepID=UPI00200820EA|nr:allantoate permease [Annulohypoxylon maeteangense]KAI0880796.1 allantoate permease [Annulohypoxylon maeteangense]
MEPSKDDKEGKSLQAADVDAALEYLNREGMTVMTEINEKALVRKIDLMIIPLMWACYNLQYLDKTLINYANVMGLQEDTSITGNQFSLLATLFYITYLAFEFPTGYLMQRLPTAKYLGANVILWGSVVTLNSAAKNWAALAALRTLLGCFESAVAPALILVTSMWYKRSEQPARLSFWYVGTGTGSIIGALTSFGFQHYHSEIFTSWQIMFLLFGLITVAIGILTMIFLPDNPMKSRLTREEKIWAIERLRENQTGIENKHFKRYQVWDCFTDPQTWLIVLITITSNIPNGAVSSYQATIIKGFGYTSKQTALLQIPSGVLSCISVIGAGVSSAKLNARGPIIVTLLLIGGILGGSLLAFSDITNKGALLTGNYLTNVIGATLPLIYSYSAANYAGHTKKVTMNAVLLISFCLGNIIGPLTFRDADKPGYLPAKIVIVVSTAVSLLATGVLMTYYVWENRRRDRLHSGLSHDENSEFFDLTDRENKEFRYRW